MKKIKNQKRVFAITLVVLMLATIFTVSASADTVFNDPLCECFTPDSFIELGDKVGERSYKATGECSVCHTSYEFVLDEVYNIYPYYQPCRTLSDENGNLYFLEALWHDEDKASVGDCSDLLVTSVSVIDAAGDKGMVGSMVGTITQGVGGILVGVGSSIVGFFDSAVLDDNGNLTTFATWALAFLGIAFGLGVVKFITYLVKK